MANPEHVQVLLYALKNGGRGFKEWREQQIASNPDFRPDFRALDLKATGYGGFRGLPLVNADFSEANLHQSGFKDVALQSATFDHADIAESAIWDVNLTEASLRGTNLRKTAFINTRLDNAILDGANLESCQVSHCYLDRASLSGANLKKSHIQDVLLRGADLSNVDFSESLIDRVICQRGNFSKANFRGTQFHRSNFDFSNFTGANLHRAMLRQIDLSNSNFEGADLSEANLVGANLGAARLMNADLSGADLTRASLHGANLANANLRGANLSLANLTRANCTNADLSGCRVYGMSAWDVRLDNTAQVDLIITPYNLPHVTVDNVEVAQFVYLLLNNENIRSVIDTIGNKGVLILGRFTDERKPVLEAMKSKLRELGFVPMIFDFDKPTQRDFTETIRILAGFSRFIIADITNPRCAPLELQATVPDYMIPLVPIIDQNERAFAMFEDLQKYQWVLQLLQYDSIGNLIRVFEDAVVQPALRLSDELFMKKAEETVDTRHVRDYLKT